ncbi:hypothetical protein EJ04DRAFT_579073 [Polyplosphaeria fusca]|uniref:F-box domain-containing protein n=1 Tax=Polyplosphaeria fusca TaxID=682080 RepID=A0A9P4QPY0_9PLEO|nr:hypothetical protein EJ04DRAFT_579073 [Polyplosphaeria fusca]
MASQRKALPSRAPSLEFSRPLRTPVCPTLPPELWIRILSHHPDPAHLWTTCRTLSRTFLAYTEQVFAEYHLRNTSVIFPLEKYNLGGQTKRPEAEVEFERFGDGPRKVTAYFGLKGRTIGEVEHQGKKRRVGKWLTEDEIMKRWEDRMQERSAKMPGYLIRIGTFVNDTHLPNLSFDPIRREISFEWRGMFTAFFREQLQLRALKKRWEKDSAKKFEENRKQLAKGEKLSVDDLPKSWASMEVELRKKIRRARLKEWYKDDEEMVWALGSLKQFENYHTASARRPLPDILGLRVGERWNLSLHVLQGLYLDEWSCMHRIDTKVEHLAQESKN